MKFFTTSILSLVIMVALFTSCNQVEAQKTDNSAQLVAQKTNTTKLVANSNSALDFDASTYDFGQIKQGDIVNHKFSFTNNSSEPVTISKVKAACGCTVGEYKKEPIMPGETSMISASFNSKGKSGKQRKTLSVFSSMSDEPLVLTLSGEIKVDAPAQTAENQ